MEQNFYRDEFEQMLKDTTEDFRMYPSRKVWHSIYNDLHPDRKWPSFTVCLILITSILYIGISNNNSISKSSKNLLSSSLAHHSNTIKQNNQLFSNEPDQPNTTVTELLNSPPSKNRNIQIITSNISRIGEVNKSILPLPVNTKATPIQNFATEIAPEKVTENTPAVSVNAIGITEKALELNNNDYKIEDINKITSSNIKTSDIITNAEIPVVSLPGKANAFTNNENIAESKNKENSVALKNTTKIAETVLLETKKIDIEQKRWMEDFAFYNKRNRNKWKTHLSEFYLTPSIGYRQLYKNNDFEPANALLLRTTNNMDVITQQAALNLEAGAALILDLNKKFSFKAGLQVNYSNYITYAHALQHPTQTTVLMNDLNNNTIMPVYYNSYYGNIQGSNLNRLNNNTLQISLPLGINYKLAGTNKIKWFMGTTIQPSYVNTGNVYLISADSKNFVEDRSMLRNWNLNSTLETFVSIKTPGNIRINAGPQFRYQLLSTYSKQYSYSEKLYNFGLKLGITKKL
jgi:hypothetical protein